MFTLGTLAQGGMFRYSLIEFFYLMDVNSCRGRTPFFKKGTLWSEWREQWRQDREQE
jgi:hypothetical protein